jgi:hypothetical protein
MAFEPYVGLYGNVAIQKAYCKDCGCSAFIIDGRHACCGEVFDGEAKRYKRECTPEPKRRKPSPKECAEVIDLQEGRCIYCEMQFGGYALREGRAIKLKVVFDHFVPYSFTQNNYAYNFVASCHICNGIKSDKCFPDLEEARAYICNRRSVKGII